MQVIIKQLEQCSQFAPILAHWAHLEWYKNRNFDFNLLLKKYQKISNNNIFPTTLVAIVDSLPVGMVSLKENDLWSRKDLNPWLSSLYVIPDFRKMGIGEKLISDVLQRSRSMRFDKIYLFLGQKNQDTLSTYYTKRKWFFLENALDNDEEPTMIYYYDL